jgi:protein O-GlcNAc transferase
VPGELSRRGWELSEAGDANGSLACHREATTSPDAGPLNWFHRARSEQALGSADAALSSFTRAVKAVRGYSLPPREAQEAWFQLAKLQKDAGMLEEAAASYRAVLDLAPTLAGAHIMLGVVLRELGRVEESVDSYTTGLALNPSVAAAQYNRAQGLLSLGRRAEATEGFREAVRIDPAFALAYEALGQALADEGKLQDAAEAYKHSLELQPQSARTYYALGKILYAGQQLGPAIAAHQAALAIDPTFAYAHNDLGNALSDMTGRAEEVRYHYSEAARLMPTFAEAFSNLGTSLKELGLHAEAAESYTQAIALKPTLCEAHKNLGSSYVEMGRPREAVASFTRALKINPQFWPALYALLDAQQFLCDWRERETRLALLQRHLEDYHQRGYLGAGPSERMHGGLAPFNTLVWPVTDETRLRVALNRARRDVAFAAASPFSPPLRWPNSTTAPTAAQHGEGRGGRLRLGFLSSDFGEHPVGWAMLPWLQQLATSTRLELICFATDISEKRHAGTPMRRAIAAASHQFYDLSLLSDAEAARAISDTGVDVLLNLVGHTAGARHAITQYRPAPVQASHYGYAGTTALPQMHYIQLDNAAAPPRYRRDYTERMAYLPHSHFIAAHARRFSHTPAASVGAHPWASTSALDRRAESQNGAPPISRHDLGLQLSERRLRGVALCNFNQLYKMDPDSFHTWANALRRLPDASLWLSRVTVRKDSSALAEASLRAQAAAHGVQGRLGFAWKMPDADFVSIRALADVMVDNRWYNAHTTGADTLWAGVPTISLEGRSLASRASSSFARSLGLGSMVAPSWKAYEDAIVSAGANPARLHRLRRQLLEARHAAPFFDLASLARAQERLADCMWRVHEAQVHMGGPPMHIIVAR